VAPDGDRQFRGYCRARTGGYESSGGEAAGRSVKGRAERRFRRVARATYGSGFDERDGTAGDRPAVPTRVLCSSSV
jgi:hypothetical protein